MNNSNPRPRPGREHGTRPQFVSGSSRTTSRQRTRSTEQHSARFALAPVERGPARRELAAQLADAPGTEAEPHRHLARPVAPGQRVQHRPVPRPQPRPPRREVDPERRLLGHPRLRVDRQRLRDHTLVLRPDRVYPRHSNPAGEALDLEPVARLGDRRQHVLGGVRTGQPATGADRLRAAQRERGDERLRLLPPPRERDEVLPRQRQRLGDEVGAGVGTPDVAQRVPRVLLDPRQVGHERRPDHVVGPGRRAVIGGHGLYSFDRTRPGRAGEGKCD